MNFLKSARTYLTVICAVLISLLGTSCEDFFDYEGDCDVVHKVRFVYNRNLKWADAFPAEVNSVNLYVFDSNGVFVKEYFGRGDELSRPDYYIVLDLPAGDYQLLAWCGLDNGEDIEESFSVPVPVKGVTRIEEMTCKMNTSPEPVISRSDDEQMVYSNKQLHFMFHGLLNVTLEDNHDGREYIHTVELTKDTNHIRIILQELSNDEGLNEKDYIVSIESANGCYAYDNSLVGNQIVRFTPWAQFSDVVGVGRVETDGIKYVKGLVADLSVGRMMVSDANKMMLTIRDAKTGENIIARVPIIQYAMLSREYYEQAYGHVMTDQELLDREDEFVMTFFLYNNRWIDAYIDILSWRIVWHNYDV
ncbi:MAG: FimB/Mfa2 family fimbrial subunit [Muribaculaceae bacterium]|nr:FimB/Mfa2 family fimbrial subunit [Muribaculaceae bacterium]